MGVCRHEPENDEEEEHGDNRKRKYKHFPSSDDDVEESGSAEEDTSRKKERRRAALQFIDDMAVDVSDDEEEEPDDTVDDFIQDTGDDLKGEENVSRAFRTRSLFEANDPEEEDVEELEKFVHQRYGYTTEDSDDEATEVDQQALLASVNDPSLWMVACRLGHERKAVACLMQKFLDYRSRGQDLRVLSAVALDHLKGYLYMEAKKEAYVKQACRGLRMIYGNKIALVPLKEMTDVLIVESKTVELDKNAWVRIKIGTYKGDIGQVVDVDHVGQRVTVRLVPRIDLHAIAARLEGKVEAKRQSFAPPAHFISIAEVRGMRIPVDRKRDPVTGEVYDSFDSLLFKDGFLLKSFSIKTVTTTNVEPSFEELQKFHKGGGGETSDAAELVALLSRRKKGYFIKGDAIVVIDGDLKNLMGIVEKVEDDNVFVKPKHQDVKGTLIFKDKQLCKSFKPGDHVRVIAGKHDGTMGMVVKVETHNLVILSDTTKEDVHVFSDHVIESSEATSGLRKLGDYELHDLVSLDQRTAGIIISVESNGCWILKAVPERTEIITARLRDIQRKICDRNNSAQDCYMNNVSLKDLIRVVVGRFKGKEGLVEHIYRGILFIHDRHYLENGGFICVRASSCSVLGCIPSSLHGKPTCTLSFTGGNLHEDGLISSARAVTGPPRDYGGRFKGCGRDGLLGKMVKIRVGAFKGYRGRVVDVINVLVRIELESQTKVVTVQKDHLQDVKDPRALNCDSSCGHETPMEASVQPFTPIMGDLTATPMHGGMTTPPYSPSRDGNKATTWEIPSAVGAKEVSAVFKEASGWETAGPHAWTGEEADSTPTEGRASWESCVLERGIGPEKAGATSWSPKESSGTLGEGSAWEAGTTSWAWSPKDHAHPKEGSDCGNGNSVAGSGAPFEMPGW